MTKDKEIKLDQHGLPLVPQPSRFKDDPLNWPTWLKWAVLIQVGYMAFLGPYNAALVNPSLVLLSDALDVSPKVASYSTTTAIIMGGVSPFIYAPLANIYGRRPITLCAIVLTIIGGVTSASSNTLAQLVGTRALCGFGFGGMMSRGEATGVYSLFVTNGAHVAAIIGGFLGSSLGWQWDYWIGAISTSVSLLLAIFLFPETLFSRDPSYLSTRTKTRTIILHAPLPFHSVSILVLHVGWTFINVMPAISLAAIYTELYNLKSGPIGACLGVSLMIGSLLGEFSAGKASDYVMYRMAKKNGDIRKPEYRLYLCCLSAVFMPMGLIVFGATVGKTHYTIPLIGLGLGVFGLQIASTTLYAYVSDCYKPQTPETGVLFNLSRGLSFVVGYFALPFADEVGFTWAWFTFAVVLFMFFIPVGSLIWKGEQWRMQGGKPGFHGWL
ncbi:MFS multidrug transporter [Botrytis cinerea]